MADSSSRKKDYSSQVRKKLANSTRTGQACDRCKLRKIRCDADPNGCAGCRAAAEPCETTDRITRKAFRRGHADQLETENANLKSRLHELQQKLAEFGVPLSPDAFNGEAVGSEDIQQHHDSLAGSGTLSDGDRRPSFASSAEMSIWQKHMNNLTGGMSSNPAFSMLRGTTLSLFGMQIDLAEFAEDLNDIDSPQTFSGFIYCINASNTREHLHPPPLPPNLKQAREYAGWFFKFLNAYTPILDKREMDKLLVEVYSDPRPGPRPGRSAAEETMVHMMFAYIKYQYGQRNHHPELVEEAIAHLKYSAGFIQDMLRSRTFRDIQAMSLIVLQLRGLQRPGACWILGQLTVNLAIECGLHRSADSLAASERQQMTPAMIESRKRVFWALYGLATNNSTRLGRPPPLRLADIDIEFPLPVHDYLDVEEPSLTEFQKCSYQVGIAIAKLLALYSDLHCTLYTISKPSAAEYSKLVSRFKSDLEVWRAAVPQEISDATRVQGELNMYAMYLDLFEAEFRFLLYHPLLHPSNQPTSYKRTLQLCEGAISDALKVLWQVRELRSLDVPWHTTTLLLAMTFTQLFIGDQRGAELTAASYERLESDMRTWLDLFGTVGTMLGSGSRLQNSVQRIAKNVLDKLKVSLEGRTTPAAGASIDAHYIRTVPEMKNEQHGGYSPAVMPTITGSGQFAAVPGQGSYTPSFDSSQGVYTGAQISYNGPSYDTGAGQPKQVATMGSTIGYSAPGGITYYPPHDANLNTFIQHSQPDYITPSAATTLMSLSDARSSAGSAAGQIAENNHQWPMNYYSGGQYATSHPG
ncbi:hypothetical protein, variant 1 [Verruconis gallopava]|uniref:Zn(2)-C6 fungal-type domain-containing protein n=1 Tax=Verruconis gallopava TaxID=253628 RepID=A0A0D2AKU2_9PEZI|nr:hypothetical protein, variant 1 [Verruconis gallopava]KIV99643.1 hypothetical protein, variant 1 [Verruconis gallopava]